MKVYKIYRNWIIFYLCVNSIFATISTFFGVRENVTQILLFTMLFFDINLIIYGVIHKKLSLKFIESVLIFFLFLSMFKMILFNPFSFSRRIITDFINPLFFVFKVAILRIYIQQDQNLNVYLTKASRYFLLASTLTILLYFVFSQFITIYIGLTPPVDLPFVFNLLSGNILTTLYVFVNIFLTGKRAFLLASLLILLLYLFTNKRINYILKISLTLFIILFSINFYTYFEESENPAIQKYFNTINTYKESDIDLTDEESLQIIDKLSGGRYSEITSSIYSFNYFDYLFGKGPGYTYQYSVEFSDLDSKSYSNVHFTPINLVSKYGILFSFLFFIYLILPIFKTYKSNYLHLLFSSLLLMYLIEMFFSFNVFVEPLIPFSLAFLTCNYYKKNVRLV